MPLHLQGFSIVAGCLKTLVGVGAFCIWGLRIMRSGNFQGVGRGKSPFQEKEWLSSGRWKFLSLNKKIIILGGGGKIKKAGEPYEVLHCS
jgi:hypothetical protein